MELHTSDSNRSGYKNVYQNGEHFVVQFALKGKKHRFGMFKTAKSAAIAYAEFLNGAPSEGTVAARSDSNPCEGSRKGEAGEETSAEVHTGEALMEALDRRADRKQKEAASSHKRAVFEMEAPAEARTDVSPVREDVIRKRESDSAPAAADRAGMPLEVHAESGDGTIVGSPQAAGQSPVACKGLGQVNMFGCCEIIL